MEHIKDRLLELVAEFAKGKPATFAKNVGIPHSTFHNYTKGRMPHSKYLIYIRDKYNINIDWVLTGKGNKYIKEGEDAQKTLDENPIIAELLECARRVLKSGNQVAFEALERNIRYFAHTIEMEKRLRNFESRLADLEEKEKKDAQGKNSVGAGSSIEKKET